MYYFDDVSVNRVIEIVYKGQRMGEREIKRRRDCKRKKAESE